MANVSMYSVPPEFYELCRLCLSCKGEKMSIYGDIGSQRNFPMKIRTCLAILVSEQDMLPSIVCYRCAYKLDALHEFMEVSRNTDFILKEYFSRMQMPHDIYNRRLHRNAFPGLNEYSDTQNQSLMHDNDYLENLRNLATIAASNSFLPIHPKVIPSHQVSVIVKNDSFKRKEEEKEPETGEKNWPVEENDRNGEMEEDEVNVGEEVEPPSELVVVGENDSTTSKIAFESKQLEVEDLELFNLKNYLMRSEHENEKIFDNLLMEQTSPIVNRHHDYQGEERQFYSLPNDETNIASGSFLKTLFSAASIYSSQPSFEPASIHNQQASFVPESIYTPQTPFRTTSIYSPQIPFETESIYNPQTPFGTESIYNPQTPFRTASIYSSQPPFGTASIYSSQNLFRTKSIYSQQTLFGTEITSNHKIPTTLQHTSVNHPKIKNPVGRPRTKTSDAPPKIKNPVGRPRTKTSDGPPRIKNPVGRPRTKTSDGPPKIKNPVGRPRTKTSLGLPKTKQNSSGQQDKSCPSKEPSSAASELLGVGVEDRSNEPGWPISCLLGAAHYMEWRERSETINNEDCKKVKIEEAEVEHDFEIDEKLEPNPNPQWYNKHNAHSISQPSTSQPQLPFESPVSCRCSNCNTQTTTIWHPSHPSGETLCSACSLYYKLHNENRPTTIRRDTLTKMRNQPTPTKTEPRHEEENSVCAPGGKSNSNEGSKGMLAALQQRIHPHLLMAAMQQQQQLEQEQLEQQQQHEQSPPATQASPQLSP